MREFTFSALKEILLSFRNNGYQIMPVLDYVQNHGNFDKAVILRHDVDRFPAQTKKMAEMEAKLGIRATYYFRIVPSVYKPDLIKHVVDLGHEVGYHYEDLSLCYGDRQKSYDHFKRYLGELREYYPIKTICMHGSPLSKWDNKDLWKDYDYKKFDLLADTSFDIDYSNIFYITDNGRAWNRKSVSVRDKVEDHFNIPIQSSEYLCSLPATADFPSHVMINAHPDTFFDYGLKWYLNNAFISSKNLAKWVIVKYGLRK